MWHYERERRASISGEPYITVEGRELIFGFDIDRNMEKLLIKVSEKFCPSIIPRKLSRDELDIGENSVKSENAIGLIPCVLISAGQGF